MDTCVHDATKLGPFGVPEGWIDLNKWTCLNPYKEIKVEDSSEEDEDEEKELVCGGDPTAKHHKIRKSFSTRLEQNFKLQKGMTFGAGKNTTDNLRSEEEKKKLIKD